MPGKKWCTGLINKSDGGDFSVELSKGEFLTIFRKADIIDREADREVCL